MNKKVSSVQIGNPQLKPYFSLNSKVKIVLFSSQIRRKCSLMHASKAILNLPTSSLHLCSLLQQNRKVKIHHQFTSFPKQLGQDSPPRK